MSIQLGERFTGLLIRLAFFFEPLAPPAISYFLSRRLNEWKKRGLISAYKTQTTRLGKFHYKIEVDLDVNQKQTDQIIGDLLHNQLKRVRRWFNV